MENDRYLAKDLSRVCVRYEKASNVLPNVWSSYMKTSGHLLYIVSQNHGCLLGGPCKTVNRRTLVHFGLDIVIHMLSFFLAS